MFTGQQTDTSTAAIFDGDIVIFENRPFAIDGHRRPRIPVAGETVVEAVFGYSGTHAARLRGRRATNSVLLRWPSDQPDPEVKVGGWIADVTYERELLNRDHPVPAADCPTAVSPALLLVPGLED